MYRNCTTEVSVRHQRQAEAALQSLMRLRPYEEVTVTDICREAGLSRRIFYHLFTGKQDALCALVDHAILDMEGFRPQKDDLLMNFLLFWMEKRELLDALTGNSLQELLLERMLANGLREDFDVWRWLRWEAREDRQDILTFNLCGLMGLIFSWHRSGFRKSPEQMAQLIQQLMDHPLAKHTQ